MGIHVKMTEQAGQVGKEVGGSGKGSKLRKGCNIKASQTENDLALNPRGALKRGQVPLGRGPDWDLERWNIYTPAPVSTG